MKKTLSLLLSVLMLFTLFSCSEETGSESTGATSGTGSAGGADLTEQVEDFINYYSKTPFSSYAEVAAVYSLGISFEAFDISALFTADKESGTGQKAGAVISYALLEKSGIQPDFELYDDFREELSSLGSGELEKLATVDLCDLALAMICSETEYDKNAVLEILTDRQVAGGGISAVEIVSGDAVVAADPDATAAAMTVFAIYKSIMNSTVYDNTLMYIYNTADPDDKSFKDSDGNKSAVTTSKTLTALMCAGISINGQLCADIKATLDEFRYSPAGDFNGMRDYIGGTKSAEATAEAFMAFAFSVYGPTWIKLELKA